MKTWAKVAIGCLVVLVVFCVIAIVTMIFAGAWVKEKVGGLVGNAVSTGKNIAAIQQLDQKYPFTEPEDGVLSEPRLQAFLDACQQARAVAMTHQEILQKAQSGSGDGASDAKKILDATSALTTAFKEGLESNQMSPAEFRWISQTAYDALNAAPAEGGSGMEGIEAMARASLEVLEPQLNDPSLTPDQRQALESQISEIKAQAGEGAPGGNPNAALAEQYRSQLEAADIREYIEIGLGGH